MTTRFALAGIAVAAWLMASLSAVSPASAGGPPIKTQQCNVTVQAGAILLAADVYVANAGNGTVTAYQVTEGADGDAIPTFVKKSRTATGLSLPLGLALSGSTLYVANRGSNSIAALDTAKFDGASNFTAGSTVNLKDMTGPVGIAVDGGYLYVANNGKYNGFYSVTIHNIASGLDATSAPMHLGGSNTGLCNPAAVAVGDGYLYVANRESAGGSITVYDLGDLLGLSTTTNLDVHPVAMMLHDPLTNELAGPVGLYVDVVAP